jgi:Flp pilus assembly pilin Flp
MSLSNLHARLARLRAEEGQTLIEYAGMALLISVVVIILLSAIGLDIAEWLNAVEDKLGVGSGNTIDSTPGTDDVTAPAGVN